ATIHNEKNSVHDLLEMTKEHFYAYRSLEKRMKQYKKDQSISFEPHEQRELIEHNKALYEIVRIFAFASMYIDVGHAPGRGTFIGDKLFLVSKMVDLMQTGGIIDPDGLINTINKRDNPFKEYTKTETVYWKKTRGGKYVYKSVPSRHTYTAKFESMCLVGSPDLWHERSETINVLHIDFRDKKTDESSADKILRQELDSPKELLDERGFRFVVETEGEAHKLVLFLAHNLSSGPETGWAQKPKWQKNSFSGSNFRCLKGTLKIFHKRQHMKGFIERAKQSTDPEIRDRLEYLFEPNQGRILETEIQIFVGKDSYIAAHRDRNSPAYHGTYRKGQVLEELALLFPPAIFPETHQRIISLLAEKKTRKVLETTTKNISMQPNLPLFPLQSHETSPDSHL
ncbi:MAG: hypothetical protein Q8K26_00675, partial [Candidatus Gracilibacteria bacterium]|nr:hypothetical protein [Candidatus Gracilibacteria bacterium]